MGTGLAKRVAQFRYLGYGLLGSGLLLADTARGSSWIWGLLLCAALPMLLHALATAFVGREQPLRLLQVLENLAGPAVAGYLGFPAAQLIALLLCLLVGNLSQGGLKRLPDSMLAPGIGWVVGDWARVRTGVEEVFVASFYSDMLGYAQLLVFAGLISLAGYAQTMRMHAARGQLREQSQQLKEINHRIAKYVGPELSRRLLTTSREKLPLRRLWVSACFVDLVGFTDLSSRLAPEAVSQVVTMFLSNMAQLASNHGGRMDRFLGDGVLITFGDLTEFGESGESVKDVARENLADAMLSFTAAMPSVMRHLNRELESLTLADVLRVRMGGASGYCTVGDFGDGERLEYTVVGPPVNIASRLEALAPVDGLLIDEATHRLARNDPCRTATGEHLIKGLPKPLALWKFVPA